MTAFAMDVRELSFDEIDFVSGGVTSGEVAVMAGVLGVGAACAGTLALVPGPHTPAALGVAAVLGIGAAVLGVVSAAMATEGN